MYDPLCKGLYAVLIYSDKKDFDFNNNPIWNFKNLVSE